MSWINIDHEVKLALMGWDGIGWLIDQWFIWFISLPTSLHPLSSLHMPHICEHAYARTHTYEISINWRDIVTILIMYYSILLTFILLSITTLQNLSSHKSIQNTDTFLT